MMEMMKAILKNPNSHVFFDDEYSDKRIQVKEASIFHCGVEDGGYNLHIVFEDGNGYLCGAQTVADCKHLFTSKCGVGAEWDDE